MWKNRISRDLFYVITFKLDILVGHSGQILARVINTIKKMLNLRVTVCHLGGPFSAVFPEKKTINYSHVTYFIRLYWSYNIKVFEIVQAVSSTKIKPNSGRVIADFRILCKLDLSHSLTCLRTQ